MDREAIAISTAALIAEEARERQREIAAMAAAEQREAVRKLRRKDLPTPAEAHRRAKETGMAILDRNLEYQTAMSMEERRPLIERNYAVMAVVDAAREIAQVQGSGKTFLTELVSICATGRPGALFSVPEDDAEWRKQITSTLLQGTAVVVIDNIAGRLDPECPEPFRRTNFTHPNLIEWVAQNRSQLLWSLLTLARAWTAAGKPAPLITPMGSYESWSNVVGGILQHAQIDGFLDNAEQCYADTDLESVQWEQLLLTLHRMFGDLSGDCCFSVADITGKLDRAGWSTQHIEPSDARELREALPDYIADSLDRPGFLARRLGRAFVAHAGRRFGQSSVYIEKAGTAKHAIRWSVKVPFPSAAAP